MNKDNIIDIEDLTPDAHNFNRGTDEGRQLMQRSLTELGAGRSILVDRNGNVIAGNKTQEAAIKAGIRKVRVIETDGTELVAVKRTDIDIDSAKGRELALVDNLATQVNLAWDEAELEAMDVEGFDPASWGLNLEVEEEKELNVEEDDFGEGEKVEPIVQRGEIWQLGDHRLMCGDSTSAADVAMLMNGERADMWLTDPPYNVDYSAKVEHMNEYMKKIGEYKLGGIETAIKHDKMSDDDFHDFLHKAFVVANDVLKEGGAFYVWSAQGHAMVDIQQELDKVGLIFRQQVIWKKKEAVLGRMDYQGRHEPCFYGWKEGAGHYFVNFRNQTTVVEDEEEIDLNKLKKDELKDLCKRLLERPHEETVITEANLNRNHLHPTMKPVRLFGRLVRNSSRPDEIILDTFAGSGTTIVACEQLDRRARLMELDPHYCDVIIARWEKLTGGKATKLNP